MGEVGMVTPSIEKGELMVKLLDQANSQIYGAFWYLDEADNWSFYLYTPITDKFGKRHAYEVIRNALSDPLSVVPLRDVKLLPAHSPLLVLLDRLFDTPYKPGLVHRREIRNSTVSGHLIREAWIYRLALKSACILRIENAINYLRKRLGVPDFGGLAPAAKSGRGAATMPPDWQERRQIEKSIDELNSLRQSVSSDYLTVDELRKLWDLEYQWGLMDPAVYY